MTIMTSYRELRAARIYGPWSWTPAGELYPQVPDVTMPLADAIAQSDDWRDALKLVPPEHLAVFREFAAWAAEEGQSAVGEMKKETRTIGAFEAVENGLEAVPKQIRHPSGYSASESLFTVAVKAILAAKSAGAAAKGEDALTAALSASALAIQAIFSAWTAMARADASWAWQRFGGRPASIVASDAAWQKGFDLALNNKALAQRTHQSKMAEMVRAIA